MSVINPATKLQWYQKHMPKKLNAAKAIFLHEVSDVLSNFRYVCVSDNVQLRQYYKGPTSLHNQPSDVFSDDTWENDVLGLNFAADHLQSQTLEAEVESYLLDSRTGTNSLMFWQVWELTFYDLFDSILTLPNRRTSIGIPLYSHLLWISCPFKGWQYLVNVCSHLRKRQCLLAGTISCQNHILPELMEALQMLKFSVQKGRGLSFTEGWDKESELRELEKLASDEGMILEDMMAFIASLDE